MAEKIILGIDPGTQVLGYGVIICDGKKMRYEDMGVFKMSYKTGDHFYRLHSVYKHMVELIEQVKPDEMAAESPYFGKNVQSMLKLGRAQGVIMASAFERQIPIFEYSPRRIKQAITGQGASSKEQVAGMLQNLLKLKETPTQLDASDGLAAAVCHHFTSTNPISNTSHKGWGDFLKNNPDRLG